MICPLEAQKAACIFVNLKKKLILIKNTQYILITALAGPATLISRIPQLQTEKSFHLSNIARSPVTYSGSRALTQSPAA